MSGPEVRTCDRCLHLHPVSELVETPDQRRYCRDCYDVLQREDVT